jgi:flagellar motor switch protein FliN/FliY
MKLDSSVRQTTVDAVDFPEVPSTTATDTRPVIRADARILEQVQATLQVQLGIAQITVAQLFELQQGSILKLENSVSDLVEIKLNQHTIARGEIVAIDDHFGVRITQITDQQ